ncbi:hypothetical protein Daura_18880 [Dactylosporangium aurantiacum]|uniref:Uncharacterized protein n=1 Tax=Dactylosporangium aurantiacum TaxID=35754 RepID=A0A9Q9MME3_9ACTN|nr:hypothetical protein [Dactylosporangium aurantiacum]MDG6105762.1 hypothetical protein [Dactylosporangium aurantiacum]UWZ58046.1 hypothetical protein Daura_18880 [Dactylosporangium aurantiacum]
MDEQDLLTPAEVAGADELYWTLDSLDPRVRPAVTIEPGPGRRIVVAAHGGGGLTITYREHTADAVRRVEDVDVLAAHRAIMACLRGASGWHQVLDQVGGSFGTAGVDTDYEPTGLSVANAVLDDGKRRRRRGLPTVGNAIGWGARRVTTGDTWRGVPDSGTVTVRALRPDPVHEHGIAIRAAGGTLSVGGAPAAEVIVWPTAEDPETVVAYVSPAPALQVCNVYLLRGAAWERVDRWSEQAGMVVEAAGDAERVYHCNHASTTPPTFADLTVRLRLGPPA